MNSTPPDASTEPPPPSQQTAPRPPDSTPGARTMSRPRRLSLFFSSFNAFQPSSKPFSSKERAAAATTDNEHVTSDDDDMSSINSTTFSPDMGSPRTLLTTPSGSGSLNSPQDRSLSPGPKTRGRSGSGIGAKLGAILHLRGGKKSRRHLSGHSRETSAGSGYLQDDEATTSSQQDGQRNHREQRGKRGSIANSEFMLDKGGTGLKVERAWRDETVRNEVLRAANRQQTLASSIASLGPQEPDPEDKNSVFAADVEPILQTVLDHSSIGAKDLLFQPSPSSGSIFVEGLFELGGPTAHRNASEKDGEVVDPDKRLGVGRMADTDNNAKCGDNNNTVTINQASLHAKGLTAGSPVNNDDDNRDADINPRVQAQHGDDSPQEGDTTNTTAPKTSESSLTVPSEGGAAQIISSAPRNLADNVEHDNHHPDRNSKSGSGVGTPGQRSGPVDLGTATSTPVSATELGATELVETTRVEQTPDVVPLISVEGSPQYSAGSDTRTAVTPVQPRPDHYDSQRRPARSSRSSSPPVVRPSSPVKPSRRPSSSSAANLNQKHDLATSQQPLTSKSRPDTENSTPTTDERPLGMISHHQSASTGAASSSSTQKAFPPYPYAHLYPQQQQPQASSSRHHHHLPRQQRAPHSHHGHGSGSGFANVIPHHHRPQKARATSPPPMGVQQSPWQLQVATRDQGHGQSHSTTKASGKTWWSSFNLFKKDAAANTTATNHGAATGDLGSFGPDNATPQGVVFGRPLKESLQYASVQISTANSNGELYVWGHIPVVVAKCGLYLKENATEVQGTFRVNGSNKRMRELQEAFETPPRYGKDLVWTEGKYNTHDVASVFRRYLTQMPEPVIPYELYHQFRDALAKEPYNQDEVIAKYKSLIRQMPRGNQYLLLYVLDLLSVFARKSDINLMTATNLAVIFRPGLLSHPEHEMVPQEHALSQKVLEFLIAHQDWFMLDVPPPPPRRGSQQQQPTGHERRGSEQHQHHGTSSSAPNPNSLQSTSHGASKTQPPLTPNSVTATAGHGSSTQHTVSNSSHSNGFGLSPIHAAPSSYHPPSQSRQPPSRFGLSSGRPLSDVGIEVDDVMVIPSGALEEQGGEFSSGVGGGGWRSKSSSKDKDKEREKEKERIKMMRRRTTMERSGVSRFPFQPCCRVSVFVVKLLFLSTATHFYFQLFPPFLYHSDMGSVYP
ncbi:rho GTPase activator, variant 2 [Coprinopsis cinerea AmutBmut pab1-1]|nr:rho GTPase activator, variant 2 [Coprinopsis cinerea AmutBmut pab1-1]